MIRCALCRQEVMSRDRRFLIIKDADEKPLGGGDICPVCSEKLRRKLAGQTRTINNKAKHHNIHAVQRQIVLDLLRANPGLNALEITAKVDMSYEAVRSRLKDLERDGAVEGTWVQGEGRRWSPIYRK